MRCITLAAIVGLVVLPPTIALAERPLATSGVLTATVPNGTLCRSSIPITVRGPDAAAFTADPAPIEKLVAAIRAAIGFECQGKPSPERLVLTGKAKGVIAYQAVAEAAHQWAVTSNSADQNSASTPSKSALSASDGSTSDTNLPESGRSAQANLDETAPLPGTTPETPGDVSSFSLYPNDEVTTESTRTAELWGLPMLQGMPYLPRANEVKDRIGSETFVRLAIPDVIRSNLGAQHIGNFDTLSAGMTHAAPAVRAWTRMMYAAGLASSADVLDSLDDNFFASLACIFLERDVVKASPGGDLCDYMPSRSQAEEAFAVHDLAENFRENDLPRIMETAPHLPFRFLVVLPASIRNYDLEKKHFAVWPGDGNEFKVSVLGSDITELKELYWPVPENDARKFISTHKGQRSIQAYIAIPLTITGVHKQAGESPNGGTWLSGQTGLLGFSTWTVEAGQMSLFADSGLQDQLYAFGEAERFAVPTEGTPLADTPKAAGPVPLNPENLVLALLQARKLQPDQVDWSTLAELRWNRETLLRRRTDWKNVEPWGIYFTERLQAGPLNVDGYRSWSISRADIFPKQFVEKTQYMYPVGSKRIPLLSGDVSYSSMIDEVVGDKEVNKALEERGIQQSNLMLVNPRLQGTSHQVLIATPLERTSYGLDLEGDFPGRDDHNQAPLLIVELRLDGVDQLTPDTLLVRLQPTAATLQRGEETLASTRFPEAAWPDPQRIAEEAAHDAAAAAAHVAEAESDKAKLAEDATRTKAAALEQATNGIRDAALAIIGGEVGGPDIVGIRLGMSFAEAEKLIRSNMEVGWVWAIPASPLDKSPTVLTSLKAFVRADEQEVIALLDQPPIAAERVLAVRRWLAVPRDTSRDQLVSALSNKYGKPRKEEYDGKRIFWADSANEVCAPGVPGGYAPTRKLVSGDSKSYHAGIGSHLGFREDLGPEDPQARLDSVAHCGPEVIVDMTGGKEGFQTTLADARVLGALVASRGALSPTWTPGQQVQAPAIKF